MTSLFRQDIQTSKKADGHFQGKVSDNWSVNGVPNGGYLMALMANALLQQTERKAPVVFTANYLNRTDPGEISIVNDVMVQSKQFDRRQVGLIQTDKNGVEKERVRAMVTLMSHYDEAAETRYESHAPDILPRSECQRMIPFPGYSIFSNVIGLMEPSSFGWMAGDLGENSEHRGWLRLKDEQEWDVESILLASDAFPPPVLASQGLVAWVPTIELSVQIRRIPTTRWLKCVFRSKYITGGLVEEDGEIWDEDGNLVAVSRQLAQFRRGESGGFNDKVQAASMKVVAKALDVNRWWRNR